MRTWSPFALALVLACTQRLPHPTYRPQTTDDYVEVPFPPPPAHAESVPPRPTKDAQWVDGEWYPAGTRWSWHAGHWVAPQEGKTFSPWAITHGATGAVYLARGVWRDADAGRIVPDPPSLADAKVTPGPIVDSEGNIIPTLPPVAEATDTSKGAPDAGRPQK